MPHLKFPFARVVAHCQLIVALVGSIVLVGSAFAQDVPFKNTSFPNVQERNTPGAQVWHGMPQAQMRTRHAGEGRIPPTIVRGKNGTAAILNPSWFSKVKASPNDRGKLICEDGYRKTDASHASHTKQTTKKSVTSKKTRSQRVGR